MTAAPRVHQPLTEIVLQDGFFAGEVGDPWAHLAELRAAANASASSIIHGTKRPELVLTG